MPKRVDHAMRREQIAHAACELVASVGFERATVARIAAAVGYTTGMLAHYYKSKDAIVLAALRLILRRMEQRLTQRGANGDDLLQVLSECLPLDKTRATECAFWTAFWGTVATSSRAGRLNAWVHREYVRLFDRCMALHWPDSRRWPKDVRRDVLLSIMAFINGLTTSAVTSPTDWPAARQSQQLAQQLRLLHNWAQATNRTEFPLRVRTAPQARPGHTRRNR